MPLLSCVLSMFFCDSLFAAEPHAEHVPPSLSASGQREWTTAHGERVRAAISGVTQERVLLRTVEGEKVDLALQGLEGDDLTAVSHWRRANEPPSEFGDPDVTLRLKALQGQMRYDQTEMSVAPGKKVRLILENVDDMHHNWVLCRRGRDQAADVAQAALSLAGNGFERHWIPQHAAVLYGGRMVDPQSTRHYYFVAPAEEGDYPYVCTLPGHAAFMKGILKVRARPTDLSELTYTLYHGKFDKMPGFDALTPVGTDHVPGGLFDLSVSTRRDDFAIVFDALLHVSEEGPYEFRVTSDDGSILKVGGRTVVDNDGIHGAEEKRGTVELTKGAHPIQLAYFESSGDEALSVRWSKPGMRPRRLSVSRRRRGGEDVAGMPIGPRGSEARIYRNFIEGAGNRAIGVGYPEGINLAFDADQMRLGLVWLGAFMDAARHWNGRGQGHQPPLGYGVQALVGGAPFARLASSDQPWPAEVERSSGYIFRGYRLEGPGRYPVFHYTMGDTSFLERPEPSGHLASHDLSLIRHFVVTDPSNPTDLYFRAAVGDDIRLETSAEAIINETLAFEFGAPPDGPAPLPVVRRTDGGKKELLVPLTFHEGTAAFSQRIVYALEIPNRTE